MPATSAASRSVIARSSREVPDAVERVAELLGEPRADLVAVPEQAAEILHPLEVRDRDAAGVREHVREHEDAALGEDRVAPRSTSARSRPRRRAARAMRSAFSSVTWSSRAASTRMSHGSSSSSAFVTCSRVREVRERAVLVEPRVQRRDVEPVRRRATPPDRSETAIDGRALRRRARPRRSPPTLPKPCTTQRCSASFQPSRSHARSITITTPAPVASCRKTRAADRDRLAGDDLRHGVALLHRVRVHHPRHRLLVRRHVGRGDVLLRADDRRRART